MLFTIICLLAVKKVRTTNRKQVSGAAESKQQLTTVNRHFKMDQLLRLNELDEH